MCQNSQIHAQALPQPLHLQDGNNTDASQNMNGSEASHEAIKLEIPHVEEVVTEYGDAHSGVLRSHPK